VPPHLPHSAECAPHAGWDRLLTTLLDRCSTRSAGTSSKPSRIPRLPAPTTWTSASITPGRVFCTALPCAVLDLETGGRHRPRRGRIGRARRRLYRRLRAHRDTRAHSPVTVISLPSLDQHRLTPSLVRPTGRGGGHDDTARVPPSRSLSSNARCLITSTSGSSYILHINRRRNQRNSSQRARASVASCTFWLSPHGTVRLVLFKGQ
jgi:hypothetical protein